MPKAFGYGLDSFSFFTFGKEHVSNAVYWGCLVAYYRVSFSLRYFIQAMVIETARMRFAGENPTFSRTFNVAVKKLDKIMVLAVIASVVSIIAQLLRQRGAGKQGARPCYQPPRNASWRGLDGRLFFPTSHSL
ncbi:hypothetical protein KJ765_00045 [Candidatus Micrarchaeota archaeon]|nr:hypothetical protein [Candidatus Micrarchaeota archaeon]